MKNFNEYRFTELKKWFSFYGRASRKDYILTSLIYFIIEIIIEAILLFVILYALYDTYKGIDIRNGEEELLNSIANIIFKNEEIFNPSSGLIVTISFIFNVIIYCILFCLNLSISARRFHDIDYSGWAVITSFIPIVNIIFFFILVFKKGTVGMNSYGSDPLDKNNSIDFFDTDD